jgi:flagellar M-ring protein FliF
MADLIPMNAPAPLDRLRAFGAQPALRRTLPWIGGLAALGGVALVWSLVSSPPQRMLYTELSDSERASVVAALDKAAITYAIDNQTGALSVGEDDFYRARMLVAADGALATPESGADALNSLPLGASRTLEGERLKSAREHELQLTIMEIDGVEAVRVHLAEAARSVFVRDNSPPSASVMVRMARGRQLGQSQVAAVVSLVAGSVPGMAPDAVRVADQHGRLLSEAEGGDSERFELQARMEEKLRGQLDQLLTPMLGAGNFSSEIQIELDMDEVTSARESYDKDGVVRSETQQQSTTTGTSPAIGIPGQLSNTPGPAASASPGPPQGTPATAAAAAPTPVNGESQTTRSYELGREVAVANSGPGKLKRLSVAVALSQAAMKKAKAADIEQIKQLVSAAVGADTARGDQVAVMVRPFEPVAEVAPAFYETGWFATALRSGAAVLAVLLVLLIGVRPLIAALRRRSEGPATAEGAPGEPAALPVTSTASDPALLERQIGLAQRIAAEKPDEAAQALRDMLAREDLAA